MAAAEPTAPSVLEGKANNVTAPALPEGDQLIALDRATIDRRSNAPVLFYGYMNSVKTGLVNFDRFRQWGVDYMAYESV